MIDEKQLIAELEEYRKERTRTHRERASKMLPEAREISKATLTGIVEAIEKVKELIEEPGPINCGCRHEESEWCDVCCPPEMRKKWIEEYEERKKAERADLDCNGTNDWDCPDGCECFAKARAASVRPEPTKCSGNGVRDDCPTDCECRTKAAEIAMKQTDGEEIPF